MFTHATPQVVLMQCCCQVGSVMRASCGNACYELNSGCMALRSPVAGLGSCGSMLLKVCGKSLIEPQLPPVVHGD